MRIAFYAPMKPPDHPVPSGDRRMAGLLMRALAEAGHEVALACHLIGRDGEGDPVRQERLARIGGRAGEGLSARYQRGDTQRPDLWFTYHLYYKAPDWIGPYVARRLALPYVVAEASVAPKRAEGPWALGHAAVLQALDLASAVVTLNPADAECLPDPEKIRPLAPFLDTAPYGAAARHREAHRARLARTYGLDPGRPWLIAVAMMRPGDKEASYRVLAEALARLDDRPWQLILVGDGPARESIETAFAGFEESRLRFVGARALEALPGFYAASDLLVWPAVREAYGMALLEAQASGLPVVAGREGGVPAIVAAGETGLLTPPGDGESFAEAMAALLDDSPRRRAMGRAAASRAEERHGLAAAAQELDAILTEARAAP